MRRSDDNDGDDSWSGGVSQAGDELGKTYASILLSVMDEPRIDENEASSNVERC